MHAAAVVMQSHFFSLPQASDQVQVTYVWNDGRTDRTKSKSRVLSHVPVTAADVPVWGFGMVIQDPVSGKPVAADHFLRPIRLYKDPFRGGSNRIVLCDTLDESGSAPASYNTRVALKEIADAVADSHEPWIGIEQEYVLMESGLGSDSTGQRPLGWPVSGFPDRDSLYEYMHGVGGDVVIGREIHESAYRAALYAGVGVFGENSEAMPAQWEFQVGPSDPLKCADDIWMLRFILARTAESFRSSLCIEPRSVKGKDWPGTGTHTNISTRQMRDRKQGREALQQVLQKLQSKHSEHMLVYDREGGKANANRLTGGIVNCRAEEFTTGIADRCASVRIPQQTANEGAGYIEDRRPAGNADPYRVIERILRTICQ